MAPMGRPMPFPDDAVDLDREDDQTAIMVGDAFDNLSPRAISTMRYTNHNDWMDQVVSYPSAIDHLLPYPFTATESTVLPSMDESLDSIFSRLRDGDTAAADKLAQVRQDFANSTSEFTSRLQQEMADMTNEHATKKDMIEKRRQKTQAAKEEFEKNYSKLQELGEYGKSNQESRLISKGGLLDQMQAAAMQAQQHSGDVGNPAADEFNAFTNFDTAGEELDLYAGDLGGYDADQGMTFNGGDAPPDFT